MVTKSKANEETTQNLVRFFEILIEIDHTGGRVRFTKAL